MVAYSFAQRLTPTIALAIAGAVGALAALAALLVPGGMFEDMVLTSGIAAFVPAAEPPLGMTARLCLAGFTGGGAALLSWGGLSLMGGAVPRRLTSPSLAGTMRRSKIRRADAHPDAPPREPLRAGRDLGFEDTLQVAATDVEAGDSDLPPEPVIEMGAPSPTAKPLALDNPADPPPPPPVQPLPADLDQPLAAFDPAALLDAPLPPPRPVTPLASVAPSPIFEDGERFETFDLAPAPSMETVPVVPITGAETVATVHSLLDRLERGMARRAQPVPVPAAQGLESTLESLRRMAVRG